MADRRETPVEDLIRSQLQSEEEFTDLQSVDDTNKLWLTWKAFFLAILNKHAPLITIKTRANKLPYVNIDLRRLIRQWDYFRGKANRTGSKLLRQAFNQMRSRVNHELYKARKDYYTSQIEKHKDNLKDAWKIIKHAIGQSRVVKQPKLIKSLAWGSDH